MSNLRILVCGNVDGNFKRLFSTVDEILKKKGAFEYLFCVGNFFHSENNSELRDLKSGKIKVPITTYVLSGDKFFHEDFYNSINSVPNITYLGKRGYLTGTSGLKVAYLSGMEAFDSSEHCLKHRKTYFFKEDVDNMINSFDSGTLIDILLTSAWPKCVDNGAVVSLDATDKGSIVQIFGEPSYLISNLAKVLKPRYHFCGLANVHYERTPYRNHVVLEEKPVHITRFTALGSVGNNQKQKWLYAFNITPACSLNSKELTDISSGFTTPCPYESIEKLSQSDQQFFFRTASPGPSVKHSKGDNYGKKLKSPIDSSRCWFCLSNLTVEKQLIIAIGNHSYVTLAKGVLVSEHVLIVPINHTVSSVELSSDAFEEVEKFKEALASYFHSRNKDVVFFERNYSSPHLQIQVVPIPKDKKVQIEDELFSLAKYHNLEFNNLPSNCSFQQVVSKKQYFYIEWMMNKTFQGKYLHVISQKFPLQFGRMLLASKQILNVEDRITWQKCQESMSEAKEMAENMRQNFKKYDFTQL